MNRPITVKATPPEVVDLPDDDVYDLLYPAPWTDDERLVDCE